MSEPIFDQLEQTFQAQGANAAVEQLCNQLLEEKDYENLFYARLMAKRYEMGISPNPTAPTDDIPEAHEASFEEAIREGCREVADLYLKEGRIVNAYPYYRMIGETERIADALRTYEPEDEDEQLEELIQIALNEGVLPKKGFDWIIDRFGICSAITTLGSQQIPGGDEVRHYCIGRAVWNLYEELRERLINDIEQQEGNTPEEANAPAHQLGVIRKLMQGRDFLFGEDCYHLDLSHLNNAVQMSMELPPGEDLEAARELCEYGARLSGGFQSSNNPPFEDEYKDFGIYLDALAGERQEEAIAHFRAKVEKSPVEEIGTGPAEVLTQLLLRLNRQKEAAEVACQYLAPIDPRLAYVSGLCEQAGAFDPLRQAAREQNNPVQFLAGLLAEKKIANV